MYQMFLLECVYQLYSNKEKIKHIFYGLDKYNNFYILK